MRVLLLHNRYRALGGEERVVAAQAALLARHGHSVEVLERDSADIPRLSAARGLLGGGTDPESVYRLARHMRADVVHAHNLHPRFGWRALAAARRAGAKTVLQLHNFRLFCAVGIAYRDGRPCHDCRGGGTWPGLAHRCRGSVAEAAVYAAGLARQHTQLLSFTDRFIVLSHGHGQLLAGHGLATAALSVVPNFVADADWAERSHAAQGTHALVAGRLVEEKGFDTAVRAAAGAGVPLVVAGSGPHELALRELAAQTGANVHFGGWMAPAELAAAQAGAGVVLVPSRCEESFGLGVLDAFAAGVPVIASPRGGLAELVRAGGGTLLDPEAPAAWAAALAALWRDPDRRGREGSAALTRARAQYGEQAALSALLGAYAAAGAGAGAG